MGTVIGYKSPKSLGEILPRIPLPIPSFPKPWHCGGGEVVWEDLLVADDEGGAAQGRPSETHRAPVPTENQK